jgi:hypothetical protein
MPRVDAEFRSHNFFSPNRAELAHGYDVKAHVSRSEGRNIFDSQSKEPRSWMESSPIGRVVWSGVLFFQMDKGAGDLDEAFKKKVVFVPAFQPEVLEDIVRFVVVAPVETLEIPGIAGMENAAARGLKGLDKVCDTIVLRHGING